MEYARVEGAKQHDVDIFRIRVAFCHSWRGLYLKGD